MTAAALPLKKSLRRWMILAVVMVTGAWLMQGLPLQYWHGHLFPHFSEDVNMELEAGVFVETQQNTPGLRVEAKSYQGLEKLYHGLDYHLHRVRAAEQSVPQIYLAELPRDLIHAPSIEARKAIFITSLLPLILKSNHAIIERRKTLLSLAQKEAGGRPFNELEQGFLNEVAATYGGPALPSALLKHVDTIPVSLALAQAIEESGWGTSRFAREGNALYGQQVYGYLTEGMMPARRPEGRSYRVRAFPTLYSSVEAYMHNLNTHPAYSEFRQRRADIRSLGLSLDGLMLIDTLHAYSERGPDYIETLQTLIVSNQLTDFDRARLGPAAREIRTVSLWPATR